MNLIESIQSALYERVVSPLAGVFVGVWCVTHYEAIFILFSDFKVMEKIQFLHEYFVLDAKNKWSQSNWSSFLGVHSAPYYYGLIKPLTTSLVALGVFSFFSVPAYFISMYGKFLLKKIRRVFDEITPIKASAHSLVVEKYKKEIAVLNEKEFKNEEDLDSYKELYRKSVEEIEVLKGRVSANEINGRSQANSFDYGLLSREFKNKYREISKQYTLLTMFFNSFGYQFNRLILKYTSEAEDYPEVPSAGGVNAEYLLVELGCEVTLDNGVFVNDILDMMLRKDLLIQNGSRYAVSGKGGQLQDLLDADESQAYLFCKKSDDEMPKHKKINMEDIPS